MGRFRSLKARIRCLLLSPEWEDNLNEILDIEPRESVGPLFSFLLSDSEMKWRAVTALGLVVSRLADNDMEQARIVMRRFLWHMNEESGNIGWGIAESMGEVMANHPRLADDYNRMLHSYIRETGDDDNFLDHPPLRRGVYWGIGRLAQQRPDLVKNATRSLLLGLEDEDHHGRGIAAWALGILAAREAIPRLEGMLNDSTPVELFDNRQMLCTTAGELARQALDNMNRAH